MNADTLIKSYIEAWETRNFALFGEIFAPSVTYWDPLVGEPITLGAMGEYVGQLLGAFPDLRFDVSFTRTGPDFGTFEWIMRGTNRGESPFHLPTHKVLALPGIDLIRVADGKIQSVKAYFDLKDYAEQLGLSSVQAPETAGVATAATA
ncbi:ester cyclase [Tahibacter amnicola]|uniref:Ester cyclase n=1 Tax=Tahibacter amnicola TaxID=2976241 RepID=A0ABY6BJB0_9GAMM|nr:ester cyclase [Tahibacter amnicola]UXI69478.1 ester cyclase [Tahibacter amnicola]